MDNDYLQELAYGHPDEEPITGYAQIKRKEEWLTPIPISLIKEQINKEMILPYITILIIKSIALTGIGLSITGLLFIFVLTGSLIITVPFLITTAFLIYTYKKYEKL